MAAAMKTLWGVVQWRWTPFFGIVGGTLLYVLLVALIVPTKIGEKKSKGEELVVISDDSPPITAAMGASPRSQTPRGRTPMPISPPPSPSPMAPAVAPMPEPMERPEPVPPPAREVMPEPPPPPPPPPAQHEEPEEEEEEEPAEQGAMPRSPSRAMAGALRMLPPAGGRPPIVPPAAPEPEPEPDEPDEDE